MHANHTRQAAPPSLADAQERNGCDGRAKGQDLFLRSRISANTCQAGLPASPRDCATSGTSARRNGFAAFSSPTNVGMVGLFSAISRFASCSRAASTALPGSIVLAKEMFAIV